MSIHFMYMSTFKTARRASTSSSIVAADVTAVARVLKSLTLAERKGTSEDIRSRSVKQCQTNAPPFGLRSPMILVNSAPDAPGYGRFCQWCPRIRRLDVTIQNLSYLR